MSMRVVFRVDASLQIGNGHVFRCLALADALRRLGAECSFICREHPGGLISLIRQNDFSVQALPSRLGWEPPENVSQHLRWLGADWQTDAEESKLCAEDAAIDWLVVDHYALDSRWEKAMRTVAKQIMVIDDLANREHACDLLLDQNLGRRSQEYEALVQSDTLRLIGPNYALLRPEFSSLRCYSQARRHLTRRLRSLLVCMGGVDQYNATGQVLNALRVSKLPADLHITVVMGAHSPYLAQVKKQSQEMPYETKVLVGVKNMAALMANSDLAIGAAGGSAWERCSLGLPSFILVLAENQIQGALALQRAGAAVVMKSPQEIIGHMQSSGNEEFVKNVLAKLSRGAGAVTDGAGCRRVVSRLLEI